MGGPAPRQERTLYPVRSVILFEHFGGARLITRCFIVSCDPHSNSETEERRELPLARIGMWPWTSSPDLNKLVMIRLSQLTGVHLPTSVLCDAMTILF